ncbi:MAG: RtcB family protein [Candidatus Brocadiia bacterium]
MNDEKFEITRRTDLLWEVPRTGDMNVPVRVYADGELFENIRDDGALKQAVNVACLPGIVRASFAMPDAHWGYGFPIGGVAAFDSDHDGVISPGGIGFDINCGVRLLRTDLRKDDVKKQLNRLLDALYQEVPCGVGSSGGIRKLSFSDLRDVMLRGAGWAVEHGFGRQEDLERTEAEGALDGADPDQVSNKAVKRGCPQVGTLGSGNHFLEVEIVDEVFDESAADAFGVQKGTIALQIHCGSRGFGHQVCKDNLKRMQSASNKYGIKLPDKQLAAAPLESPEGRQYFGAMAAAANFAWCNRQVILSLAESALEKVFGGDRDALGLHQVYDVCHNIAKFEEHQVDGENKTLCVHRKGATRAFPPGHPEVSEPYHDVGQPVLIPGDMGSHSYLLAGASQAMKEAWGSSCHGAGRTMSRRAAKQKAAGRNLEKELSDQGVMARAEGRTTLAEEMPYAYKDIESVVSVMHESGIVRKVARLKPIAVVKG